MVAKQLLSNTTSSNTTSLNFRITLTTDWKSPQRPIHQVPCDQNDACQCPAGITPLLRFGRGRGDLRDRDGDGDRYMRHTVKEIEIEVDI